MSEERADPDPEYRGTPDYFAGPFGSDAQIREFLGKAPFRVDPDTPRAELFSLIRAGIGLVLPDDAIRAMNALRVLEKRCNEWPDPENN